MKLEFKQSLDDNQSPEKMVYIGIKDTDSSNIVQFLIDRAISFSMVVPANPKSPRQSEVSQPSAGVGLEINSAMESAYQKYINGALGPVPPKLADIAAELKMGESVFKAFFKNKYGKPFYQVYLDRRMEQAARLLKKGHKCNEVSQMVGYGERSAIKFNKMFQKHFGITPKKYQMTYREQKIFNPSR